MDDVERRILEEEGEPIDAGSEAAILAWLFLALVIDCLGWAWFWHAVGVL